VGKLEGLQYKEGGIPLLGLCRLRGRELVDWN